jgi:tRNA(fMet)-specific endonuclease VapC
MPNRYLLDTNILSDLIRNPQGSVANKIAALSADERDALATSVIVAAEMRYGAAKKRSPNLSSRVDQVLEAVDILPFEPEADRHYGFIRVALEEMGTVIGANDLLIAAHAIALDAVLISDNVREFERVPGLRIENWLRS